MANADFKIPEQLFDFIRNFQKEKEAFDSATVRIGIIGESGCGKSSLINKFAGKYISEVGATETTNEPLDYSAEDTGVVYTDLPGSGTAKWPIATYVKDLRLDTPAYDAFIIMNRGRILENDIAVYKQICETKAPVFVVRNFFDAAVNGEHAKPEDRRRDEASLRAEIEEDFRRQFGTPGLRVFLTATAPDAPLFDFDALQQAIAEGLERISAYKKGRWELDTKARSREMLDRKRDTAKWWVHGAAALAAGGAVVPIPGAGIAVDAGAVVTMNRQVLKIFNLDAGHADPNLSMSGKGLLAFVAKYGSREEVVKLMVQYAAKKQFTKEVAKWIPVVGTVSAMALAIAMTEFLGLQFIDECYDISLKIIEGELKL